MKTIFIGGGNMATALIGGILKEGVTPGDIQVVEPLPEKRQELETRFGVTCLPGAADAEIPESGLVTLAVKPQQMRAALSPIAGRLTHQIVLSIAAGLPLETLSRWLGGYRRVVRAMPNTPALVGAGMTGLCALPEVALNERLVAERVLGATGATLWIEDETLMDAVTAISGSGPAYLFLFIEALQQAAVELGLAPDAACRLAIETTLGAAKLAAASGDPVAELRERVTSRGGTTAAALEVMARKGVAAGIIAGAKAAEARGRALARELGAA
ncbi:MAG: pyrroline-5-carboxylate reductase [Zoogloeaceae bacterium]|jgi:pyrroline-5-carboxylate reductase|nr:pyrroline-5-carboxylate reductase [Zoogloeaceae bacterium]